MTMMKAVYRITEQDYVGASKLSIVPTKKLLVAYAIVACLVLATSVTGREGFSWMPVILLIIAAGIILLGRLVFVPLIAKRGYRQHRAIQDEFTLTLQDNGLHFLSNRGDWTVLWGDILKWRENKSYVILFIATRAFHIIPKSIDSNEFSIPQLTSELANRIGPAV